MEGVVIKAGEGGRNKSDYEGVFWTTMSGSGRFFGTSEYVGFLFTFINLYTGIELRFILGHNFA